MGSIQFVYGSHSTALHLLPAAVLKMQRVKLLEIRTGFPLRFFCVSKTCHDTLSTKNRDKVSVSVFVTVVTVYKCAKNTWAYLSPRGVQTTMSKQTRVLSQITNTNGDPL